MKIQIITFLFILTTSVFATDHFNGSWKHVNLKAKNYELRLSFKESAVNPTYGLHRPGRIAYAIHLDVWGNLNGKSVDYSLSGNRQEFNGTLVKDSLNHQYDKLTPGFTYIWLEGNEAFDYQLNLTIDDENFSYELNL